MKSLNWWGWNNSMSGYGIVNLEYSTALSRLGVDVSIGWERENDMLPNHFSMLTQEQKDLIRKPFKKERVGVIKTTPQMFIKCTNDFRIGYTMVENTMINDSWVEMCNRMNAIFVPSPYLVDVFTKCGVTVPIRVVHQGIDSRKFPYFKRKKKRPFVFGTIGYMDERKNWKDLIQAFYSEFAQYEPVELWIKNSNKYFEHMIFNDKRIKIINKEMSFDEVSQLYTKFDCFVFPSHAEGSGLPPREAMATGCPTILTNWSGLEEVCDPKFNYPLTPISIDYPDPRQTEQPGFQARLDVRELMYYMRYVYEHQDEALEKGKLASEWIHKDWSWDSCAKDLLEKVEKLSQ